MKSMNIIREFEVQRKKDSENVKEYLDRLLSIVIKVRMFGNKLPDSRVIDTLLVTLPEKFEPTIASIENMKDLSRITLEGLQNALHVHEQRTLIRQEGSVEGALQDHRQNYP